MFDELLETLSSLSVLLNSLFGVFIFPLSLSVPGSVIFEIFSGVRDNYIQIEVLIYWLINMKLCIYLWIRVRDITNIQTFI